MGITPTTPNQFAIGVKKLADMAYFQYGASEVDYLKQQDPQLALAIERIGPIERPVMPDLFTALISSIVHQQISNKAAVTVWGRVVQRLGSITPQAYMAVRWRKFKSWVCRCARRFTLRVLAMR